MEKVLYRFVGTECIIGPVVLERFGQRVNLTPDFAREAQMGGAALLPEDQFQAHGFTDDELRIWADPFMPHFEVPRALKEATAKAEFQRKQAEARQTYVDIRHSLLEENVNAE